MDLAEQVRVTEIGFVFDPLAESGYEGDGDVTVDDFRVVGEQVKDFDEGGPTVDAAVWAVEVDEFGGLADEFADGLEVPMFDDVGDEAFFLFDFHGVEDAAVGVDADEEVFFRLEIFELFCGIRIGHIFPLTTPPSRAWRCHPFGFLELNAAEGGEAAVDGDDGAGDEFGGVADEPDEGAD